MGIAKLSISSIISGQKQSYEETLTVTYQPLSVFRVRPVTRCVETMPGHTDAVLHVSYSPDGKRLGEYTFHLFGRPILSCHDHDDNAGLSAYLSDIVHDITDIFYNFMQITIC